MQSTNSMCNQYSNVKQVWILVKDDLTHTIQCNSKDQSYVLLKGSSKLALLEHRVAQEMNYELHSCPEGG